MARLIEHLGLTTAAARGKPRIRVAPGDVHLAAAAAERVLAADRTYFQAGGPIVRIAIDPGSGAVSSELVNDQTLISVLSAKIEWEKRDKTAWVRCDPPSSEASRISRRLPLVSRSTGNEQDDEQVFA